MSKLNFLNQIWQNNEEDWYNKGHFFYRDDSYSGEGDYYKLFREESLTLGLKPAQASIEWASDYSTLKCVPVIMGNKFRTLSGENSWDNLKNENVETYELTGSDWNMYSPIKFSYIHSYFKDTNFNKINEEVSLNEFTGDVKLGDFLCAFRQEDKKDGYRPFIMIYNGGGYNTSGDFYNKPGLCIAYGYTNEDKIKLNYDKVPYNAACFREYELKAYDGSPREDMITELGPLYYRFVYVNSTSNIYDIYYSTEDVYNSSNSKVFDKNANIEDYFTDYSEGRIDNQVIVQGSYENPFVVETYQDFYDHVFGDKSSKYYSVKVKESYVWDLNELAPEQNQSLVFNCYTLDGNGATLKNVWIDDDTNKSVALQMLTMQLCKKINFENVYVRSKYLTCFMQIPWVLEDCKFSGTICGSSSNKTNLYDSNTIYGCYKTVRWCSFNFQLNGYIDYSLPTTSGGSSLTTALGCIFKYKGRTAYNGTNQQFHYLNCLFLGEATAYFYITPSYKSILNMDSNSSRRLKGGIIIKKVADNSYSPGGTQLTEQQLLDKDTLESYGFKIKEVRL